MSKVAAHEIQYRLSIYPGGVVAAGAVQRIPIWSFVMVLLRLCPVPVAERSCLLDAGSAAGGGGVPGEVAAFAEWAGR